MTDRVSIAAEPRAVVGKKVKQLRREGLIPAVIYGQDEPVHIQLPNNLLRRALRIASTTQLIDIKLNGKSYTVLAREIQQHVTRGDLIHVDFMEVDMKVTITAEATVVSIGKAPSSLEGMGSVVTPLHVIEIECLPGDLISEVEVDISRVQTPDDVVYVSDLEVPKGVTILTDPETVVARFEYAQLVEEEEEEEVEEGLLEVSTESVEIIEKGKTEEEEFEE